MPAGAVVAPSRLLGYWVEADNPWNPSTLVGYRSAARILAADPIGERRAEGLTPNYARTAIRRWRDGGASIAVVAGRFRALRAALSWAYDERFIDLHPLRSMRGPHRATLDNPARHGRAGASDHRGDCAA